MARSLPKGWEAVICPIADGGDGTLECLVDATDGVYFRASVTGPFSSEKVKATWGKLGSANVAVIEMAEAAGLRLLQVDRRSASNTTTFGVGELILKALDSGFRTILIGLGGSATNDGGTGCTQALGAKFLDNNGHELAPGGIHLQQLHTIDISRLDHRVSECDITLLTDVKNVLLGTSGATRTFAAQKGATPQEMELLEQGMHRFSEIVSHQLSVDVAMVPGSGAAGGLAAGLFSFCNARIVPGIDFVLDTIGFNNLLSQCDIVLTAEGRLDEQTLRGKGIAGLAKRTRTHNVPLHVFAGRVNGDSTMFIDRLKVDSVQECAPRTMGEAEAMRRANELLAAKVREFTSNLVTRAGG